MTVTPPPPPAAAPPADPPPPSLALAMGSPSARSARVRALSGSASSARAVAPAAAWFRVALAVRGRAFPRVAAPWLLVTVFAAAWAALADRGHVGVGALRDLAGLKSAYALVATTLGFLLVFRLNRAAARYWDSRAMWGALIAHSRAFAGSAAVQLAHAPNERDNAVRWVAALLVSTPHFLRRDKAICADSLAGVLGAAELQALRAAAHAPLYAAQRARVACARALHVGESTGAGVAARRAYTMGALEAKIDALVGQVGGMERVRGTPLPLVYVAHLRVFLLVGLLSLPLLFYDEWCARACARHARTRSPARDTRARAHC